MALIIRDRIKEGTTFTGTGDIILGGSAPTFDSFQSVMTNGDTTYYAIVHTATGVDEWEVGLGTYNSATDAIARTTVLAGSSGTSTVNFSSGTKDVFMTYPASIAAFTDGSGDLSALIGLANHDTDDLAEGATNKYYLDSRVDAHLTGGTGVTYSAGTISIGQPVATTSDVTFNTVTLAGDPTTALQAATKEYVDTIASAGLHYHAPVRVETPTALTATYNNGTSGVGATLTNSGTQAALVVDGVTVALNDRVLVYKQTNAAHNGIYTVTNTGSVSTNWVLTRAVDSDSYGASDPDALGKGDAFFVKEGDTGAGELYVMTTAGEIVFGTTAIVFTQVAETAVYSAGTGLNLTGTTFSTKQDIDTTASPTFVNVTANLTGNVTGNTAGTHTGPVIGNVTGNADTATALQTTRTIQLTGDATGSATFNGTANAVITVAVQDDSHNHIISNVDGLQTALDAKADETITISAGTGLTGGGNLTANRTLTFDTTFGDARYVTATSFTEGVQDIVGGMVSTNTENGIAVTYDDVNGKLNFDVADPTITLTGAVTGSATMTNLGNVTITTAATSDPTLTINGDASGSATFTNLGNATLTLSIVDDSHTHDGRYYTETESDERYTDTYADGYTYKSAGSLGYTKASLSGRFDHLRGGLGSGPFTYAEAIAHAASVGARLPTVEELEDEIAKGTGGGYDSLECWTCTAVPGQPGYVYTKLGTGAGPRNPTATDGTATAYTRYVATVNTPSVFTDNYHPNADKWTTARTLSLTGAVTGSASIDGSGNVSLATTATSDPTLTINGDASGSATFTNLGNATLTLTVADDSHTHDGRYYTETESDARFVNVTGDTITGSLTINGNLFLDQSQIYGGFGAETTGGVTDWNASSNARSGNGYTLLLGTHTNGPGGAGYYHPFTFEYSNKDGTGNMTQFAIPYNGSAMFSRYRYSGTWSNWTRYFDDSYHPNADTLTTARTISLTGDVSGSVSFNGSANVSITTTVADDSHTHDGRYYTESEIDTRMGYTLYSPNAAPADLNSITQRGWYEWSGTNPTNSPSAYGMLIHGEDGGQPQQLLQTYGGSSNSVKLYGRRKTNGTWDTVWTQYFSDHYHPNADKWTTARTLSLTGAVTGSASIDGSGNVSLATTATSDPTLTLTGDVTGSATFTNLGNATLTATVADDSHNHTNYLTTNADDYLQSTMIVDQNGHNGNIAYEVANGCYIPRPLGGHYVTTGSTATGAIAIKLPTASWNQSDMLSFWVDIYDYAGSTDGESTTAFIYGYQYSTGSWTNCGAVFLSDRTDRDYTVRFGHDGTRPIVYIGETSSTWSYPQVNVRDFQAGYAASFANYDNAFAVTFETAHSNVQRTSSNNYPVAKQLEIARNIALTGAVTGNANFDGSGNISITTTATSDPTLTINGDASGSATFTNLGNATLTLTVADDSHNHVISNVDGLQAALDGKLNLTGGTLTGDLTIPSAIIHSGDTNTYMQFPAADTWRVVTAGTESIRVTSSGAVGIGTSSPGDKLDVVGNIVIGASGAEGGQIALRNPDGSSLGGVIDVAGSNVMRVVQTVNNSVMEIGQIGGTGGILKFLANGGERMRLDSSGNLLVDRTSAYADGTIGTPRFQVNAVAGVRAAAAFIANTTGTVASVGFVNPNGTVGAIYSSGSSTSYNTSSDYRLKEDVQPMSGASDRVLALNPVNFAWKADGTRVDGFLAHEAQAVAPYAVTGEKDGEEMQGMDHSKLVPLLTAALQEALKKIETLEASVAQLEGN